jgi:hypothetical protein
VGEVDFGPFEKLNNKSTMTKIQRILVPWSIAMHRLSYAKSMKLDVVKQMLVAIIDTEDLIETGRSCSQ